MQILAALWSLVKRQRMQAQNNITQPRLTRAPPRPKLKATRVLPTQLSHMDYEAMLHLCQSPSYKMSEKCPFGVSLKHVAFPSTLNILLAQHKLAQKLCGHFLWWLQNRPSTLLDATTPKPFIIQWSFRRLISLIMSPLLACVLHTTMRQSHNNTESHCPYLCICLLSFPMEEFDCGPESQGCINYIHITNVSLSFFVFYWWCPYKAWSRSQLELMERSKRCFIS